MSRLIEGEFLNYRNVIPADSRTRVTIDTKEFIETIERASLIITAVSYTHLPAERRLLRGLHRPFCRSLPAYGS